jgi:hypothetical protein
LPGVSGHLHPGGTCLEATVLSAQLEERIKIHRNEVLSLLKDREISWKERNLEQKRLQDQISLLSKRCLHSYPCLITNTVVMIECKYLVLALFYIMSWVSSGSIVSDYGLDDRAIRVRSPAGAKDFSSSLCVQTGSGPHPASCTLGTGGPFPGGKSDAGA